MEPIRTHKYLSPTGQWFKLSYRHDRKAASIAFLVDGQWRWQHLCLAFRSFPSDEYRQLVRRKAARLARLARAVHGVSCEDWRRAADTR